MNFIFRNTSPFLIIFANLIFALIIFAALNIFLPSQIIPCTDTWADHLILALTFTFILHLFSTLIISSRYYKITLTAHALLILFAIWFGLYPISPLGYSNGRSLNLNGFSVITKNGNLRIANKGTISLGQGSTAAISPLMLAGKFNCAWVSTSGGALDTPASCDMIYVTPNADYDTLRVRIRSSCGLPDSIGQIKVYILP